MTPFIGASSRNEPALRFDTGGRERRLPHLDDVAVEVEVQRIIAAPQSARSAARPDVEADATVFALDDRDFDPVRVPSVIK